MTATIVEPIDQDIQVVIDRSFSPAFNSSILAAEARGAIAAAEAQDQALLSYDPDHVTFVDGSVSEDLDRVKPDGTIECVFNIVEDIFAWIEEQLVEHSPVLTGRYEGSHLFLADGVVADPRGKVAKAGEYVFINAQPYARKIERGESPQHPDGVYQAVAVLAAGRFGNMAQIAFAYRPLSQGDAAKWASSASAQRLARTRRGGRPELHKDWLASQPAIVITMR